MELHDAAHEGLRCWDLVVGGLFALLFTGALRNTKHALRARKGRARR